MYSSQNRFLKISSPAFGSNEVILTKFTAVEMLSDSYTGECDCFASAELDTAKLMGAKAQVDI
ncbi:MAG: hypothetical protein EXR81_04825, partial [Gammaproteobacteria bacterium]|nr:hypothetical protein [Gammaproteobacteria bacterium]